jgi:hypothetical protein
MSTERLITKNSLLRRRCTTRFTLGAGLASTLDRHSSKSG